jgi:simple sugar transport system ATP-binding protein
VSVSFGDFRALTDVSLSFQSGVLHVLVGQNGAGKTTLARVLTGLIQPDSGDVMVAGRQIPTGDVSAARAAGVEMVHQSFTLPPSFTVAEALELFSQRSRRNPVYSTRRLNGEWRDELAESGVDVRPSARIRELPIEAVQAVEITRALASNAAVLILDEPTAVLPPPAIDRLFARLRGLRDRGVTVILVLHKLREVSAIAETVTVLRDGVVVLPPSSAADHSAGELSDLIVGSGRVRAGAPMEVVAAAVHEEAGPRELLVLDEVSTEPAGTEPALEDVSLTLRRREIVGVAGVEGNGQRALVRVITGLTPVKGGRLRFAGEEMTGRSAGDRRAIGVRVVPFDRNLQGVSQSSPLWENVAILPVVSGGRGARLLRVGRLRADASRALDQWRVQYRSIDQRAGELSGGNVQRLILARELSDGVRVLVAAQPTRGLDVAATDFVRITLRELRDADGAVLLISSDLDELFELSDRLIVVLGGRIVAEFRPPYDVRAVGDAMVGADREGLAVPAVAMESEAVE